ncbi:response regulator, partial [Methylovulum sp.]
MQILLVEDDERIIDFVQRGLKAEGYVVEVARNGLDAIALGSEGQFQTIILDLGLPDINGREV